MYPRNMRGYGASSPKVHWPDGAHIAVQFVLNYEEGGENCLLHGDSASEGFLSDIPGATQWPNQRHWNMESIYEYGARAGFWRLHRLFNEYHIPLTVYGVASALARSPEQVEAMLASHWEIASHGLKWIEHKDMPEDEERAAIAEAVRLHTEVIGSRPRGWYTGRCSMNTVRLVAEEGGFDYISDAYDDDLPHWIQVNGKDQLIIPYTLEANDMRFSASPGYITGEHFFQYLKDTFDTLYEEGQRGSAKMMSLGLHCRLIGRPGKIAGLQKFIEYIQGIDHVWCPRRIDIANHWAQQHPRTDTLSLSTMSNDEFIAFMSGALNAPPELLHVTAKIERGSAHDCLAGARSLVFRALRQFSDDEVHKLAQQWPDPDLQTPQLMGNIAELRNLIENIYGMRIKKAFEGSTHG